MKKQQLETGGRYSLRMHETKNTMNVAVSQIGIRAILLGETSKALVGELQDRFICEVAEVSGVAGTSRKCQRGVERILSPELELLPGL